MTEDIKIDKDQNGVQHVIDIAIHSSWIELAMEKFILDGNVLVPEIKERIQALTVKELDSLKSLKNNVHNDEIVTFAINTSWMGLAKEKFLRAAGAQLDEHEHAALDCIADHELETLQTLDSRLKERAAGFTGDAGGIY
tara:strand:+ start:541 stop:957 length:417 start_codon:yes stop_codon:yes gene_type:complete